jgi:hypothetical protein
MESPIDNRRLMEREERSALTDSLKTQELAQR